MSIIIRKYDGSTLTVSKITEISEKLPAKYAIHRQPGANQDTIQPLGTSNREYTLKGIATAAAGSTFFTDMRSKTGSIYYSSSAFGVIINNLQVFYTDINLGDSGGRPLERKFTISMIEVI